MMSDSELMYGASSACVLGPLVASCFRSSIASRSLIAKIAASWRSVNRGVAAACMRTELAARLVGEAMERVFVCSRVLSTFIVLTVVFAVATGKSAQWSTASMSEVAVVATRGKGQNFEGQIDQVGVGVRLAVGYLRKLRSCGGRKWVSVHLV